MKFAKSVFAVSLVALAWSSPSAAKWIEVQSTNFRYYSEDKPEDVVKRVTNLERLDKIVRTVTGNTKPPSPLPVTVFEVVTMDDVQKTIPGSPRGVAAYYTTSPFGAHLVTFYKPLKVANSGSRLKRTYRIQDEVTQHEYLHHLMFQYFPTNYPTFYPEGFAEYYGTIQFKDDNVIVVGHAPNGRLESMNDWLPVREVLTAKSYGDVRNLGALYAEGWLLTHMAAARPEIGKEMNQYLRAVASGTPYEKAAEDAFGDLDKFDSELKKYKDHVTALTIKLNKLPVGKVTVRELGPVEEAMVPVELKLRSNIERSSLPGLANRVRNEVAKYPDDTYGLGLLALVEYLADETDQASATAQKLLSIDPESVRGNMVAGMLATDALMAAGNKDAAAWDKARDPLTKAIEADDTSTMALVEYYKSYTKQGVLPPAGAQNALMRAFQLMPRNDDVRYMLARDFEQRGLIDDAIFMISPAAYGTFDGDEREKRRRDKAQKEAAEKYTNIADRESPLDMLHRLEAKRDGKWDAANQRIIEDSAGSEQKAGEGS